jgi:hypothetical protein
MRDAGCGIRDSRMKDQGLRIRILAVLVGCALLLPTLRAAAPADRIWYVPNPGAIDLIRMFEHPEEWTHARQLVDVFQFTEQHTHVPPDSIVGPNSFDALSRAGVFSKLTQWGKHIAIGVGAVKEFYCTDDASGMNAAIADAEHGIRVINDAGGQVNFLAMDDPFAAGQAKVCGGPDLTPTADRLQLFISTIRRDFPSVRIGMIDAYPTFAPDSFRQMFALLAARGVTPAFLQLDIDIRGVRPPRNVVDDLKQIRQITIDAKVPLGLIIWGYDGNADALFARDAYRLADVFMTAFPTWSEVPEQLSFQSWSVSSTGLNITPSNLPEDRLYTLTNITNELYRRFRGGSPSPSTGTAIRR